MRLVLHQVCRYSFLLIAFAIADLNVWAGVNLTSFIGAASRFSPMIFGFIGAALMSAGKDGDCN